MEQIRNIGFLSDCIFHGYNGVVETKADYHVVRTPNSPNYHWGNFLLYKRAPRVADYDSWIAAYQEEFGLDAGHVTFGWDSEEQGATADFRSNGFEIVEEQVLSMNELQPLERPNRDIDIRKIRRVREWDAVLALQTASCKLPAFAEFRRLQVAGYRAIQNMGHGAWWGAFLGEKLVGSLGLYFNPDQTMGRFQHVDTHPDYRRKGICSTLLHHVATSAITTSDSLELIIVTKRDSSAMRIYRALGFEECATQYGASLPRPYSQRFEVDASDRTAESHI